MLEGRNANSCPLFISTSVAFYCSILYILQNILHAPFNQAFLFCISNVPVFLPFLLRWLHQWGTLLLNISFFIMWWETTRGSCVCYLIKAQLSICWEVIWTSATLALIFLIDMFFRKPHCPWWVIGRSVSADDMSWRWCWKWFFFNWTVNWKDDGWGLQSTCRWVFAAFQGPSWFAEASTV